MMPIEMMIPIKTKNENGTFSNNENKIILPIETFRKQLFLRKAKSMPKEMVVPIVTLRATYA